LKINSSALARHWGQDCKHRVCIASVRKPEKLVTFARSACNNTHRVKELFRVGFLDMTIGSSTRDKEIARTIAK
jgi:hypothetical protein